ncbi:hypothetical protein SGRA_2037 [Saprospira grandis str. Lewin]|uniref:Uncharacterized protein n=1 Tax=Saprospira grandis (strain Lewin) TaxID=984262 RepID=H6L2L1_SAPGL|nr:hypothetical protein SGRA_2037 [Saprospira grandis str. Lewin]
MWKSFVEKRSFRLKNLIWAKGRSEATGLAMWRGAAKPQRQQGL